VIDPIRSRPAVTCSAAEAESVAAFEPSAAVIVPSPSVRKAVNVVVLPVRGAIVPSFPGESDQVADTGNKFPNESRPEATSFRVSLARTLEDAGVTVSEIAGPGVIVSVCVAFVKPAADAVSTWLPARVSR
jgi:hypothetical protein